METNDVLRMFRYALNIPDTTMVNIFTIAECRIDKPQLLNLLKKVDEPGYAVCSPDLLEHFFDGLILYNRGSRSDSSDSGDKSVDNGDDGERTLPMQEKNIWKSQKSNPPQSLSNNAILKKIRVSLDLKQEDMMEIFRLGKVRMAKGEFTALFRKEGHKNYKECGDQYLRKFLQGLALRHRM